MDVIHPNVPETIKRLADAYEYPVERVGASIAYSLLELWFKTDPREILDPPESPQEIMR